MVILHNNILIVEVPENSSEYHIDDFLGNSLQYKVFDDWIYDTSVKLPSNDLFVIGLLDSNEKLLPNINIDKKKKWLLIKSK